MPPLPRPTRSGKCAATAVCVDTGIFLWRYGETNEGGGVFAETLQKPKQPTAQSSCAGMASPGTW